MLGNATLRRTIAEAGHAAYLENFTRDIVIDRLCAAYQRCQQLGAMTSDTTVPVATLAAEKIARLQTELAPDANACRAIEVAVAYAADRQRAADAALLQASGLANLIVDAPPRVLLLAQPDLDHAWQLFDRATVDVKYTAFVEALLARLFEPPASTARR